MQPSLTRVEAPVMDESDDFLTEDERKLTEAELEAIRQAWNVEVERRVDDLRAGRSRTTPSEEVHAMLRAKLLACR